jgi:cytidyltransferase-like protein
MRTIAVYPGRFHPFHKGHASSFKQLAKTFGLENTFLAISQKQEQPKSPFSAKDRAKMAVILGIPMQNILFVRNTYGGDEYMQQFQAMGVDVNNTALVLGVSGKDMGSDPRFSFNPKKDGSPSYLQPVDNGIESPMTQHAYIMTTDVAPFNIAGMAMTDASQIRSAYAKGDEELQNKILTDLYGKGAKHVKPIFDQNLAIMESIYNKLVTLKQRITESKVEEEKKRLDPSCWKGYKKQGTKMKGDTRVNNCVPIEEAGSPAQQAAIAINMKKRHQKPKNVNESQVTKVTDYDLWLDEVKELGAEIHPQKDRNVLVAQSWDGDTIGKFHLGKGYGFINQSGELDETIRKMGSQYRLLSKKGKNLGTFDSKSGAEKHEREVQYFKHMGEGEDDQFDLEKRHPLDHGIKRLMVRKLARKTGYETSALELASDEELTELYNEVFPKEDYLDE